MISYSEVRDWRPRPEVLAMIVARVLPRASTKATPGSSTSWALTASSSPICSMASMPCPRRSTWAPLARSAGKRSATTTWWPPRASQ